MLQLLVFLSISHCLFIIIISGLIIYNNNHHDPMDRYISISMWLHTHTHIKKMKIVNQFFCSRKKMVTKKNEQMKKKTNQYSNQSDILNQQSQ